MIYVVIIVGIFLFLKFGGDWSYASKFTDKQITGVIFQCFETTHILSTTKSLETYKTRYLLFKDKHQQLIKFKSSYKYKKAFDTAVNKYKSMYYDRSLNMTIKNGLFDPQNFDLKQFFEDTIYNCYTESLKADYQKIEELKTDKAKQNRLDKINLKITDYINYLVDLGYNTDNELFKKIKTLN